MSEMESMRRCHRSRRQTQPASYGKNCCLAALRRRAHAVLVLAPAQLLDQSSRSGRRIHVVRAQELLQPLAHGVADRSAGLPIDRLVVMGFKGSHGSFRPAIPFQSSNPCQANSSVAEMFPHPGWPAWDLGKICMKIENPRAGRGFWVEFAVRMAHQHWFTSRGRGPQGVCSSWSLIAEAVSEGDRNAVVEAWAPDDARLGAPAVHICSAAGPQPGLAPGRQGPGTIAAAAASVDLRNMASLFDRRLLRNRCKSGHLQRPAGEPGRLPCARAADISATNSTRR